MLFLVNLSVVLVIVFVVMVRERITPGCGDAVEISQIFVARMEPLGFR